MPFGGTTSADDFESGTIAAAHGGTTTIVDFAIQYKGQTLHHAWETWMKKAEGKAAIDYGFHMIITELTDQVEQEMDALVRQGVTSFKLFMAYPGVFMLDDASIFRALLRTGQNGGTICMHAENGGVIDVLVKQALAEGKTAPKYHALTRPARAEGRGDAPRDRARRDRRRADLHRPPVGGRGARDGDRGARSRPAGIRGDLPAVPVPVVRQLRGAGVRRREVRDEPAAAAEGHAGPAVARPGVQRPAGDLHRPLPVLHEGAEGARRGRLLEDSERRAGHRNAHEPGLRRRRAARPHFAQPLRRAHVDVAGEDLRPVPAQGHDRAGIGRRHRHLRSGEEDDALGEDAAHERGLQPVRGARGDGRGRYRHLARTVVIDGGTFTGRAGAGIVSETERADDWRRDHCAVEEAHDLRIRGPGRRRSRFRWRARRASISGRPRASASSTSTAS